MPPVPGAALEIASLEFAHSRGFALHVASLSVSAGEHVLLRGPSGTGKSTLLHLVAGLEMPRTGSIRVAGIDITTLSPADRDTFRGRHVGMIFQTFNLLPGFTALENVAIGLEHSAVPRSGRSQRARETLERLGIDECGALADELSVGQQQRVAIARAVAGGPELILADEPTASLDPGNARAAIALIRGAARDVGAALLCASHDPALSAEFDRTIDIPALAGPAAADAARACTGGDAR